MELGNSGDLSDFVNVRDSWLGTRERFDRVVVAYFFQGYKTTDSAAPSEKFREKVFARRRSHVWLSFIKVYDTVKLGYFTTGDIDVVSEFALRGYSPAMQLPDSSTVTEYAGDMIQWNGKFWEVADVLEPIQFGYQHPQTWFHTVMRRTDLSGAGATIGP